MALSLHHFCEWLASTPLSNTIQNVAWIIPLTQDGAHHLHRPAARPQPPCLDLRLFGIAGRSDSVAGTAKRLLPWIWGTLPILLLTGAILTVAEPSRELENSTFVKKMILIVVAMVVTGGLQVALKRDPAFWDATPGRARWAKVLAVAGRLASSSPSSSPGG